MEESFSSVSLQNCLYVKVNNLLQLFGVFKWCSCFLWCHFRHLWSRSGFISISMALIQYFLQCGLSLMAVAPTTHMIHLLCPTYYFSFKTFTLFISHRNMQCYYRKVWTEIDYRTKRTKLWGSIKTVFVKNEKAKYLNASINPTMWLECQDENEEYQQDGTEEITEEDNNSHPKRNEERYMSWC